MAIEQFEPSDYPAGERQLTIARSHVHWLQANVSTALTDSLNDDLDDLGTALVSALDASDAESRMSAIDDAQDIAAALQAEDDFNHTLSEGVRRRVSQMLDTAETRVDDE